MNTMATFGVIVASTVIVINKDIKFLMVEARLQYTIDFY